MKKNKSKKITKKRNNKTRQNKTTNLIYFYMEGCGYCDEFTKNLWPKVKKLKKVKTYKVNGPQHKILTDKFNIESYPTLIKLDKDGWKTFQGKRTLVNIKKFLN